mmetsp:Transcript_81995/g.244577  ORF Transcript_81995/g.244577 Transcript_81995/m.244577 type:complete len:300 (-) Transcript_81995:3-902(-)
MVLVVLPVRTVHGDRVAVHDVELCPFRLASGGEIAHSILPRLRDHVLTELWRDKVSIQVLPEGGRLGENRERCTPGGGDCLRQSRVSFRVRLPGPAPEIGDSLISKVRDVDVVDAGMLDRHRLTDLLQLCCADRHAEIGLAVLLGGNIPRRLIALGNRLRELGQRVREPEASARLEGHCSLRMGPGPWHCLPVGVLVVPQGVCNASLVGLLQCPRQGARAAVQGVVWRVEVELICVCVGVPCAIRVAEYEPKVHLLAVAVHTGGTGCTNTPEEEEEEMHMELHCTALHPSTGAAGVPPT